MTRDQIVSLAIGGGAVLSALFYAANAGGAVRIVVTIAFVLVGPGLAFVRLLRLHDPLTVATLAVGASIGLNVVTGTVLLALNAWKPGRMLAILVLFTLVCVGLHGAMRQGREPEHPGLSARQRAMAALAGANPEGGEA